MVDIPTRYLLKCVDTMPYHPSKNEMVAMKNLFDSIVMLPCHKKYQDYYMNNAIPLEHKEELKEWLFYFHNSGLPMNIRVPDIQHFDRLYSDEYSTPSYMLYVFLVS